MSKNEQEMCKNVQMRKRCRTNQDTAFDHLWFWTRIVVPTTSSFIFPIIYPLTPSDTVFKVTPNWSHINVPPVFPYYADASLGALVVSRWGLKINASFVASKCVFCVVKIRFLRHHLRRQADCFIFPSDLWEPLKEYYEIVGESRSLPGFFTPLLLVF